MILTALSGQHVEIVARDNPAAVFESDFDVLLWPYDERKKLESLLDEHEDIKEVKQQKQISRKLQYIKSQDTYLPSEARVHRAGTGGYFRNTEFLRDYLLSLYAKMFILS